MRGDVMQLSRPSKHFTDFGKQLRADLFRRLIAVRDAQRIEAAQAGETAAQTTPTTA